jgi:hypothetical protein
LWLRVDLVLIGDLRILLRRTLKLSINAQKTSVQARASNRSVDTEVELRNDADYHMYKIHYIASIGNRDGSDMQIDLRQNFSIKAQHAHETLILSLIGEDRAEFDAHAHCMTEV